MTLKGLWGRATTNHPQGGVMYKHHMVRMLIVSAILSVGLAGKAHAQALSEGPNSPGAVFNDPSFGIPPWTNPGNAVASDDAYATASPGGLSTQYLEATNFGFNIPPPAVIEGIEVAIEKRSALGTIFDSRVRIIKGGFAGTDDHSDANLWPNVDTVVTYGGPSDLWGETWTSTDINANDFGVAISATDSIDSAIVDHITIKVYYSLCTTAPLGGCKSSTKSILLVKDKTDNTKDKFVWKWILGTATSQTEFADPKTTAIYALCLYENSALSETIAILPSNTAWKTISTKGFKYTDKNGTQQGITKVLLRGSAESKAKILVKGKGSLLPDPVPALTLPVTVQLLNSDNGDCWEASYALPQIKKNQTGIFKAKK